MTSIPEITDVMTKVQNAGESGGVLLYVNEKTNEFETAAKWNLCDRLSLSWRGFTNNAEKVAGKIDQLFRNLVIKDDERPTYDRNKAVYQEALQKFKTRITTNSIDRNNLLTSALFVTKTARTVLRIALPQPGPEPLPAPIPSAPVQPASTVTFGQTRRKHGLQVVESSTHPHRENCAPTSPTLSPSSGSSASEPDRCSPSSDRSPRSPSTFREKLNGGDVPEFQAVIVSGLQKEEEARHADMETLKNRTLKEEVWSSDKRDKLAQASGEVKIELNSAIVIQENYEKNDEVITSQPVAIQFREVLLNDPFLL